jgi:hypothetical protein
MAADGDVRMVRDSNEIKLVRYSQENRNEEAFKGKYGVDGREWGTVTVVKNVVYIVAYKGAKVVDYVLPTVYDGFLILSTGAVVPVVDSKFTLDLDPDVSGFGILQLTKGN